MPAMEVAACGAEDGLAIPPSDGEERPHPEWLELLEWFEPLEW
jgi:hypothetical protein